MDTEFQHEFSDDILESVTVGIAVLDPAFRILAWNRFMAVITEEPAEKVTGRSYFEVFPEQMATGLPETLRRAIETGEEQEIRNFKHQGRNRRVYITRKKICPLKKRSGDGAVAGVIIISEDVTDKVLLGEELRRVEKLKAVGEFAASIAHEINNPIGIIFAYAEHLADSMEQDPACPRDYSRGLRAIQEEAGRCSAIVRNILELSREAEARRIPVDLRQVLDSTLFLIGQRAAGQGVSIQKRYGPGSFIVLGDPDQLKQVFFNLALNALQAMPDGGVLTVSIRREQPVAVMFPGSGEEDTTRFRDLGAPECEEQYIAIDFTDTGCGIPQSNLEQIFKPFFSTKANGAGFGLSVSRGIIENHSGTITVVSQVGEGSTFTVRLPVGEL